MKDLSRVFDGRKYKLMTNRAGITSDTAEHTKNKLKRQGYRYVRVVCDITHPEIYPCGRFFVYARKTE